MTEYNWGSSWRPKNADGVSATVVGETIQSIAGSSPDGTCVPQALVDEARAESSPLHPLFEWDDSVAGESWRRHEARMVIRAVVLSDSDDGDAPPAFVNVRVMSSPGASQGYVPLAVLLSDEELHKQAVAAALSSVRSLQRRYETLNELIPLWETLDKIEANL